VRGASRLKCEECGSGPAQPLARDWRAFLRAAEPGESEAVVVYCPSCAEREFGPPRPAGSSNPR
jgi:hypothetical protein